MQIHRTSTRRGFVAIELIAVMVTLFLLVGIALPLAANGKTSSTTQRCLENHKQVARAWLLYAEDNNGKTANNFTIPDTEATIIRREFATWAPNIMTWSAGGGTPDVSVTNTAWAAKSQLHPYTDGDIGIYRCPADKYLSPAQRQRGYKMRLRSMAMNTLIGEPTTAPRTNDRSWGFGGAYRQFLKVRDIPDPAMTWLTVDEHPDSINDGFYINTPGSSTWGDLPGTLHAGSTPFSFADGHVQLRQWQSATSKYRVQFRYPNVRPFDAAGRKDFAWYLEHSGFVRY